MSSGRPIGAGGVGKVLARAVAAGAAMIDFNDADHFDGRFKDLWIRFRGVNSDQDNTALVLRCKIESSIISAGYKYRGEGFNGSASNVFSNDSGNAFNFIDTATWRMGTGTGEKYNGKVEFSDPANAGSYKAFSSTVWGSGQNGDAGIVQIAGGGLADAGLLTGCRIIASGGNITGEFELYGSKG